MEICHIVKKRKLMNTLETFHIYNITQLENQINDKCDPKPYILFDMTTKNTISSKHP